MAHQRELLAAGLHATLAKMLGSNLIASFPAGGSGQATATPLNRNFAILTNAGATTQGVRVGSATGAGISVYYNAGPNALMLYPDVGDSFQDLQPDTGIPVQVSSSVIMVPSNDAWLVSATTPPGVTQTPGGTGGQIQINAGGNFGGFTASGDALINTGTGIVTVQGLQGRPVAATAPLDEQTLAWSAAAQAWQPVEPSGAVGPEGENAFTTTLAGFIVPPVGGTITVSVANTDWVVPGQPVYIDTAGGGVGQAGLLVAASKTASSLTLQTPAAPAGAISGVIAGTGLTGGGTGGTVTLALTTPVVVANGGTGAATGAGGLDNLAGFSGVQTGFLGRTTGGGYALVPSPLPVANGGTGAATAPAALTALGAAPIASPALTGVPTAPTAAPGTNTTQVATTAFAVAGDALRVAKAGDTMTGALTVNLNAGAVPPPVTAANMRVVGANGSYTVSEIASFTQPAITRFTFATGSAQAPTLPGNGIAYGYLQGLAWNGTTYALGSEIHFDTAEAWTATANGGSIGFDTTTPGTTTNVNRVKITQGMQIGAPPGGDLGPGSINAAGEISAGGPVITTGSNGAFIFQDEAAPANNFRWLAASGTAYLQWNGSSSLNTLTVDSGGDLVAAGTIKAAGSVTCGANSVFFLNNNSTTGGTRLGGSDSTMNLQLGSGNGAFVFYSNPGSNMVQFSGDGTCHNTSGAWIAFSDPRLKSDIEPYTHGLDEVLALNPIHYRLSHPALIGGPQVGFDAEELQRVLPHLVGTRRLRHADDDEEEEGEEYLTAAPTGIVFALVNAVKELEARLAALEGRAG